MPSVVAFGGDLTPNDIIALALRDAGVFGVGQTPKPEDTNDAMLRLNMMLAQWNRKRWLIYHLVTISKASTGAQSYQVGPQLDFNVARPDRIESAFMRQTNIGTNAPDYPLEILESREDYNLIRLKSLSAFAQYVFYDPVYPIGVVFFWPLPQADIYTLFISVKQTISKFTNLAQVINLPPEYHAALHYNLVLRLCAGYQVPTPEAIPGLAKDSLETIRGANVQIPRLQMPDSLVSRGQYDVYSDRS